MIEHIEELHDALSEILPPGFSIVKNKKGELVICTNLIEKEDGSLMDLDDPEEDWIEEDEEDDELDEEELENFSDDN